MIKIFEYEQISEKEILSRSEGKTGVEDIVADIIKNVRTHGDDALLQYAEKFDHVALQELEVSSEEIDKAYDTVDQKFIDVLKKAAEHIEAFHRHQVRNSFLVNETSGVVLGQRILPIEKVGLYVPGGTAAYPSSVLMNCLPAKIAGVKQIVMTTPPSCGGAVSPVILAAAKIAGVHRIFKIGGAQAVAALAYGTQTVPCVDKIVGPGNAFVAEAKRQVFGHVAIDMIAGPSEILVIADETCNPKFVAADMLSQGEHDKMATAVLVTDSMNLAQAVSTELERQISLLTRLEIARASIDMNGKIIVVPDLQMAVALANRIAPEHLEVLSLIHI